MKSVALAFALFATPALAQAPGDLPVAPGSVTPVPVVPTAPTPKFTLATPIEAIAADPAGKVVLNADIPGLLTHPMYNSFKGMGLLDLQGLAGGKLTDAMLAKAKVDLAGIK